MCNIYRNSKGIEMESHNTRIPISSYKYYFRVPTYHVETITLSRLLETKTMKDKIEFYVKILLNQNKIFTEKDLISFLFTNPFEMLNTTRTPCLYLQNLRTKLQHKNKTKKVSRLPTLPKAWRGRLIKLQNMEK